MARSCPTLDIEPWYRQGWPWLLIALPASAVLGGIVTVFLAVQSPNALVVDDYYREGLAINQHKRRLEAAAELGLEGLLRSNGTQVTLSLTSRTPVTTEALTLKLIHSTRSELDREVTLRRTVDGRYSGRIDELLPGVWYLRLSPADGAWQIRARITTDGPFQANLTPEA
jgi:hypothetical protein